MQLPNARGLGTIRPDIPKSVQSDGSAADIISKRCRSKLLSSFHRFARVVCDRGRRLFF